MVSTDEHFHDNWNQCQRNWKMMIINNCYRCQKFRNWKMICQWEVISCRGFPKSLVRYTCTFEQLSTISLTKVMLRQPVQLEMDKHWRVEILKEVYRITPWSRVPQELEETSPRDKCAFHFCSSAHYKYRYVASGISSGVSLIKNKFLLKNKCFFFLASSVISNV